MKVELDPIGSLQNETTAIQVINSNFDRVAAVIETLVSRAGDAPNFMQGPLDMNSNRVLNLPAPSSGSDAARYTDVVNALALDGLVAVPTPVGNANKLLTSDNTTYIFKTPGDIAGLGDLKAANNLSEVNAPTARANLGLGTASAFNVGTSGDVVPKLNTANTWAGLQVYTAGLSISGVSNSVITSNPSVLNVYEIGWRGVPLTAQDGSYTFTMNDAGQAKLHTSGTVHTYTVPPASAVPYPVGTHLTLINTGIGAISLVRGAGVNLRKAGSGIDADLSVAQWGACTVYKYGTNSWIVVGTGVT